MASTRPPTPLIAADVADPHLIFQNQEKPLITSRTRVCAPKPTARPRMPAPVRNGVMFNPKECSITSSDHAAERDGDDLVDDRSECPGALGPFERIERRAAIQLVLEARDQQRRDADQRIAEDDRREQREAVVERPLRELGQVHAGPRFEAGQFQAGKISTAKIRTNAVPPTSRSGPRTAGWSAPACRRSLPSSRPP